MPPVRPLWVQVGVPLHLLCNYNSFASLETYEALELFPNTPVTPLRVQMNLPLHIHDKDSTFTTPMPPSHPSSVLLWYL